MMTFATVHFGVFGKFAALLALQQQPYQQMWQRLPFRASYTLRSAQSGSLRLFCEQKLVSRSLR